MKTLDFSFKHGIAVVNYPKKSSTLKMSFYSENVLTSRKTKPKTCTQASSHLDSLEDVSPRTPVYPDSGTAGASKVTAPGE